MANAELTLPFYRPRVIAIGFAQGLHGTELKVFPETMHFVFGDLSSPLIRRNPERLTPQAMAQF